jgi:hypothetical protein
MRLTQPADNAAVDNKILPTRHTSSKRLRSHQAT